MADNVAITAGSGTSVATDQVGTDHYQRIKLSDGTADSSTHLKVGTVDAAAGVADTGIQILVVRNDTLASLGDTDGDFVPLQVDADGALYISAADLATLAGAVSGSEMQVDVVAALPTGSNAIGKLAANSGVDIGDVDVTSLPGSIDGPGAPVITSYANAVVDLAAGTANQTLVSSGGANTQIWVYGLHIMADTASGTIVLQDEDDTALTGTLAVSDEGGFVWPPSGNFAMPWLKLATDKDLEADTGGTGTFDGLITYAIVDVS